MLVYGARLSVVEHPNQESRSLVQAIHTMNDCTLKLFTELPLYKLYPTKAYRDFSSALSVAISISNKYLAAAQQESVPGGERGGAVVPILRQWLEDGELMVEEAATHCVEMFISGIDSVRGFFFRTHQFHVITSDVCSLLWFLLTCRHHTLPPSCCMNWPSIPKCKRGFAKKWCPFSGRQECRLLRTWSRCLTLQPACERH